MTPEEARDFLRRHHRAVLSTFRSDGRPQLSPVAATVDAEGRVVVSTRETAMKARNLRRDPRISLCGCTDAFYGPWVQVEGTAEIVERPEAIELLVDYYRSISGNTRTGRTTAGPWSRSGACCSASPSSGPGPRSLASPRATRPPGPPRRGVIGAEAPGAPGDSSRCHRVPPVEQQARQRSRSLGYSSPRRMASRRRTSR